MDNVLFHKSYYIWYFKHCFCGDRIVPCAICSVVFETMLFATDLSAVMISSRITYFHDLQIEKTVIGRRILQEVQHIVQL